MKSKVNPFFDRTLKVRQFTDVEVSEHRNRVAYIHRVKETMGWSWTRFTRITGVTRSAFYNRNRHVPNGKTFAKVRMAFELLGNVTDTGLTTFDALIEENHRLREQLKSERAQVQRLQNRLHLIGKRGAAEIAYFASIDDGEPVPLSALNERYAKMSASRMLYHEIGASRVSIFKASDLETPILTKEANEEWK